MTVFRWPEGDDVAWHVRTNVFVAPVDVSALAVFPTVVKNLNEFEVTPPELGLCPACGAYWQCEHRE